MKKTLLTIISLIILTNFGLISQNIKHHEELNKEANKKHKEYLKKLQEEMYRTEPGVNHRVVEDELKRYHRELRNNPSKFSEKLQSSEFAWGRLKGTWYERGSKNNSGRTHLVDLASDLKTVYLGSSGGNIWKGDIDGKNWTCLNNTYQFAEIHDIKVFDLNNKRRIVVSESKNIYYTDNEGINWNKANGLEALQNWGSTLRTRTIQNGSNHSIYVLTQEFDYDKWKEIRKLHVSNDYGVSFTEVFNFDVVKTIDIWGDRNYPNLYIQKQDTLFQLDNQNKLTYITESDFIESMLQESHDIKMTGMYYKDKPYIYFATKIGNSNSRMVLKYDPNKKQISYMGEVETDMFMRNSFEVSKINPNLLWLGGVEGYYSTTGGLGWTMINKWEDYYADVKNKLHADIPSINTFKTGDSTELIFVNTDGGTYISNGLPNKFTNISMNGLNVSQIYSTYTYDGPAGEYVYVGTQDQGFQIGIISGTNPVDLKQDVSGDYGAISSTDGGKNVWSVYPGYLLYYPNLPSNTQNLGWSFDGNYADRVWMPALAAMPGDPTKAVIAPGGSNNSSRLFVVSYDGSKLSNTELSYQFDSQEADNDVSAIAISSIDKNIWYVTTKKNRFYVSTNSGQSWTVAQDFKAPGYNYLHPTPIVPSRIDKNVVYVGGAGYSEPGVYVSKDGGKTFVSLGKDMPKAFFYDFDLTGDEKAIFAATSVGPYVYISGADRWFPIIDNNNPDQTYWSVNYVDRTNTARFATYGRGVWDFKVESIITSVENNETSKFSKVELFPNPANDFINIDFSKINGTINSARIFDIDGNLIVDLMENNFDVTNKIKWNLSNSQGYKIQSGNYVLVYIIDGVNYYEKINVVK